MGYLAFAAAAGTPERVIRSRGVAPRGRVPCADRDGRGRFPAWWRVRPLPLRGLELDGCLDGKATGGVAVCTVGVVPSAGPGGRVPRIPGSPFPARYGGLLLVKRLCGMA